MSAALARLGAWTLNLCAQVGSLALFAGAVAKAPFGGGFDSHEAWRALHRVGVRSLPIVAITALFAGAITVLQVGAYVIKLRAYEVVGWGFGFSLFREIGPLLIGLMFSGRVGANNTAELATMVVTEQVDALRALAIEPVAHLAVPRVLAMLTMMSALYMVGCAFALAGGMLTAQGLIGVDFAVFWNSFAEYVLLSDFINGWVKCSAFGLLVGVLSCAFGFEARGGAAGVGRAVNACVVASALGIFVLDAFITMLWR